MQLVLKRCTIRPWRLDDAESLAKHLNNPSSARVLEKAGFVFEERLKNNVIKDGEFLDSLLYAKTK
ncbi:MAG TPA: GNAT family protein [Candidatus Binatia bacterium]|nr:GNAT family protein [Candidatus Binatia bacterium]